MSTIAFLIQVTVRSPKFEVIVVAVVVITNNYRYSCVWSDLKQSAAGDCKYGQKQRRQLDGASLIFVTR